MIFLQIIHTFKGQFENEDWQGRGTLLYEETRVKIVGEFNSGFLEGDSTIIWPDGTTHQLTWSGGVPSGTTNGCQMY